MSTVKDKVVSAAGAVADAAKTVGHKIAEGASEAAAYVKEKAGIGCDAKGESAGVNGIRERMDVYASCGKKMGVVDHLEGSDIKLTRKDSADGKHHFVPTSWVGRVHENHVHLTTNSVETERDWKTESPTAGTSVA